jgi:microcystin-dependent protein
MALVPQNLGVPTGTIMWSAAPDVPVGWLLCDGRDVVKTEYPALFDFLGTEFGSTDPNTFTLPDLVGRFIRSVGEPGRDPFTYQDGMNVAHSHGMYPGVTHFHEVTDPGHLHTLEGGDHNHFVLSDHNHTNTAVHTHTSDALPTHGIFPGTYTCEREVFFSPLNQFTINCGISPFDVMVTMIDPSLVGVPGHLGTTGITAVNASFTGVTFNTAETGVALRPELTGVTADSALTNIDVDVTGEVGGPVPYNLALLPIIRT